MFTEKNFTVGILIGTSTQHQDYTTFERALASARAAQRAGYQWSIQRKSDKVILATSVNTVTLK